MTTNAADLAARSATTADETDLLIHDTVVVMVDENNNILENGTVVVDGDVLSAVSPTRNHTELMTIRTGEDSMSLLPSTADVPPEQEGELRVLGVDEDETADVFDALSSETARRILTAIYDDPAPPSELADRLDLSLQNVSYHLENLEEAGVVRVAETRYSEKGKEMSVYAPADDPVVVFVGIEERKTGFLDLLKRLVGATGLLFVVSAFLFVFQAFGQPGGAGDEPSVLDILSFPGLEFLLGGLFVLALVILWWSWNR